MKRIQKAIVSVYYKDGLEPLIRLLDKLKVELYSTGGSYQFITSLGIDCKLVESLTNFPEILDGRVKTLHPAVFGGLLARSKNPSDITTMQQHQLPFFDLLICNLYPFEEYLQNNASEAELIEKIDIGGVSLIRAAAKNFNDVVCISQPQDYDILHNILEKSNGSTAIAERKSFATSAFRTIANYDAAIADYFAGNKKMSLRYGENPHQKGYFIGNFEEIFDKIQGKEISYNNLLDINAACKLLNDFAELNTFAILKHNNTCGLAIRQSVKDAYEAAYLCDPKSAFGGVLISNSPIDLAAAEAMNSLFFEIIIAPDYAKEALDMLCSKKNRIILKQKNKPVYTQKTRTVLNGVLTQAEDLASETATAWKIATHNQPTSNEITDLEFGIRAVKHLKSNAIALVKHQQLIGMGCGQVSRIDALEHAIKKAKEFGFDLSGASMASDAFFPFADCVEIAHKAGIAAIAQPGGSLRDQDSIDYCNAHQLSMVLTGVRHFNH